MSAVSVTVTVDSELYSCSLSLNSLVSFRSSLVRVSRRGNASVVSHTDMGTHTVSVCLEVKEDIETDVVLGFDWFSEIATHKDLLSLPATGLLKISTMAAMYNSVALHRSACFIPSSDEMNVMRLIEYLLLNHIEDVTITHEIRRLLSTKPQLDPTRDEASMIFFTYIDKRWPVTPSLQKRLVGYLSHALQLEQLAIEHHGGGFQVLTCSITRIPDSDHPDMTIHVYDHFGHFLGAIHFNPIVLNHVNFIPDNPYHRATRVLDLVLDGKIPDYQVYFNPSTQRSLNTIMVI
ncbi:hypothetical protein EV421DRAFT_1905929 [Armillaria borealis]|uniref:Uncharacterized protein n=1 Tax=Armillaria borealis TaxID=47425 RepID=A0AA39MME0_9AGAR|nr:hypothetical protein EV421DRAFT_1905929 [Armillaria borealis]